MRFNIKKSTTIRMLTSCLGVGLLVFGTQAFASNSTAHENALYDNKPAATIQVAKGQVYKPPKDIYREQC